LRSKFTPDEDSELIRLVAELGTTDWAHVATELGTRNARQCRERYKNYLDPALRHGEWTAAEDALLLTKHAKYGSKWNHIAHFFKDRSDIALRNRWNHIRRRPAKGSEYSLGAFGEAPLGTAASAEAASVPESACGRDQDDLAPEPECRPIISLPTEKPSCLAEPNDLSGHTIKNCHIIEGDPFDLWYSLQWIKP
jgi:hypothetical protein